MNELLLKGCRTEPLGSYLKALGVLRLVGEQADPEARGHWRGDTFVLITNLDRDALTEFFLDRYAPTPVVSPWNNGSGFKAEKNPAAVAALSLIESSTTERLASYRGAISVGHAIYAEMVAGSWEKATTVKACRERLPDVALPWLDASVVLAPTKEVFPPMLGTGGNDGRFDFSVAFMGRVGDVLGIQDGRGAPDRDRSSEWLGAALFDSASSLIGEAIGQFSPGAAGGPNSGPAKPAPSLVNPWDWVLLIEGSMVFVSAASRRMGEDAFGRAAIPFTSESSSTGYGSSAGEGSRGEIWAPVWAQPASAAEVCRFVEEGRMTWRGHQARNGLDFARAAASLGADRGIDGFVRHALLERNGLATAAVSVGRIDVRERPAVALTGALDGWYDRVRRGANAPGSVTSAVASVERALFEATSDGDPSSMQAVLLAAAALERSVGRAERFRDAANVRPVAGLKAVDWVPALDDTTAEFRMAAALASLHDADGSDLRVLLRPITRSGRSVDWSIGSEPVVGLGSAPIVRVLAAALARRSVDVSRSGRSDATDQVGVQPAFQYGLRAPVDDIAAFALGELEDARLGRLFEALLLLDWSPPMPKLNAVRSGGESVSASWSILAPFFHGKPIRLVDRPELTLTPEAAWPSLLAASRTEVVIAAAMRRMRAARLQPVFDGDAAHRIAESAPLGERLAAALLVPVSSFAISMLVQQSVYQAQ